MTALGIVLGISTIFSVGFVCGAAWCAIHSRGNI